MMVIQFPVGHAKDSSRGKLGVTVVLFLLLKLEESVFMLTRVPAWWGGGAGFYSHQFFGWSFPEP